MVNRIACVLVLLMLYSSCALEEFPENNEGLSVKADFEIINNNCLVPCTVEFQNKSVNAESYEWKIGSLQTYTEEDISYLFENPGTHTITLTSTNVLGSSTKEETVIVEEGVSFYKRDIGNEGLFRTDMEVLANGNILLAGGQKLVLVSADGQIIEEESIQNYSLAHFRATADGSEMLTVGTVEDIGCAIQSSGKILGTKRLNVNGQIASEQEGDCNYNVSLSGVARLPNDRFATIGKFEDLVICFSCPPEGGDLVILDKNGNVVSTNNLETGEITATYTVRAMDDRVYVGGGVATCTNTDCTNFRYDYGIAIYDASLNLIDNYLIRPNPAKTFSVFTDISIGDNELIYAIGQTFDVQLDLENPLEACGGQMVKINAGGTTFDWQLDIFTERCIVPLSMDIRGDEIIVAGFSNDFAIDNSSRLVLAKVSTSGEMLFPNDFEVFPGSTYCKVEFDDRGQIIVVVYNEVSNIDIGYDLYKLKPDGTL